ncbi:MAG TPA: hypothetical protein DCQ04_07965 [Actinobacteria bacterium]|jgi:DNA-binding transcriptional MerR regulator|nr:hypothetical protein [Actinomycetota bacterium]
MQKLLDSQSVSELLDVPPRTLDQWAYLKRGPAYVKVGRHRRYQLEDVERWLAANTRGGDAT